MVKKKVTIAIASDHAGYKYKEQIKAFLSAKGYGIKDFGAYSEESIDYPLTIKPAAEAVSAGTCDFGIILGGSGNGEAIVANKIKEIRCAVCWNPKSARLAKEHNNANIISLGQRMMSIATVYKIIDTWLLATFKGERHARRISQIENIEKASP
jgi:ribose 5-phosphate isomerase B